MFTTKNMKIYKDLIGDKQKFVDLINRYGSVAAPVGVAGAISSNNNK